MNNLDTSNWKWFILKNIFIIEKSKNITLEVAEESLGNEIPYITRTEYNNGVNFFVQKDSFNFEKGNCITIGGEGANVFFQPFNFISGNNITKIYHSKLNENIGLFIVSVLNLEKYRYSYNRAWNKTCIENTKIKLPIDSSGNPDWQFMDNYIKTLRKRERESSELVEPIITESLFLEFDNFKLFKIEDLFDIKGSKTTDKDDINYSQPLKFHYITTKNQNNGCDSLSNIFTENSNCITIDSATCGAVFYQYKNFIASDHVEILRLKNSKANVYHYLFFVVLLTREQYRYGYGRKWNQINIRNTKIKLPIDSSGNPDWQFMENYIKSLPYSKYL